MQICSIARFQPHRATRIKATLNLSRKKEASFKVKFKSIQLQTRPTGKRYLSFFFCFTAGYVVLFTGRELYFWFCPLYGPNRNYCCI
nr:MAG TPA: hypothetical protein [Caudoviricetes sp.]